MQKRMESSYGNPVAGKEGTWAMLCLTGRPVTLEDTMQSQFTILLHCFC